jgi:hypothetical protein
VALSLVKAIVETHQGRVKAMSKQGRRRRVQSLSANKEKLWTLNGRGLTNDWL